ncbi:hypothetical protein AHAS_Ahas15G0267700 [Arachis hypogaea]
MLRGWFISMWWWLLTITIKVTISIRLICIRIRIIPIINWRGLLPIRLINPLRLLPSLIPKSLMHIPIGASIPYNIVVTKLIAKGMRIHNSK